MSHDTCQIEPVPPPRYADAASLLAGDSGDDALAKRHTILRLIRGRPSDDLQFWWARKDRVGVAAALVLTSPGRAGMIFFSSPLDCDRALLAQVLRTAASAGLDQGLSFVQALIEPMATADVDVAVRAGFRELAELIYMRRDLAMEEVAHQAAEDEYLWRAHGDFDDDELAQVIGATYERSLDCPALAGVRKLTDIVATHRSCGVFRPESWWVLEQGGKAAGCILVNDYPSNLVADVVYLGVTVPFRGRGLSRLMLHRTGRQAIERGYSTMTLAVDAANPPALRVYEKECFYETARRLAYAMLVRRQP
jgi:ribosomal protein S18 acetylase RimI-like enzyme